MICNRCGNIINSTIVDPEFVCPICNSKNSYIKRADDDESVIRKRLDVYHKTTAPVFDFYKDKVKIIDIDGTRSIEEVTRLITGELVPAD
jgi:adenylate kinase